jgi:hypothetical protein
MDSNLNCISTKQAFIINLEAVRGEIESASSITLEKLCEKLNARLVNEQRGTHFEAVIVFPVDTWMRAINPDTREESRSILSGININLRGLSLEAVLKKVAEELSERKLIFLPFDAARRELKLPKITTE